MPSFNSDRNGVDASYALAYQRLQKILADKEADKKKDGGFLHDLKSLGQGALRVLDAPRSYVVSGMQELSDLLAELPGIDPSVQQTDRVEQHGFSLHDFLTNAKNGVTARDYIEADKRLKNLPSKVKTGVGLAGDIVADPLTYASFGVGSTAKEGLLKAGQVVGDDVARNTLREGGTSALRDAVETALKETGDHGGARTLEDVLARGTSDLGKRSAEEHVADVLSAMEKNRRGGIGMFGVRTGVGDQLANRAISGLRSSELGQATRRLFNTTAEVDDTVGRGAGEAVKAARSSAAQARREASRGLTSDIVESLDDAGRDALLNTKRGDRLSFFRDKADELAQAGIDSSNAARQATIDTANASLDQAASGLDALRYSGAESARQSAAALSDARKAAGASDTAVRAAERKAASKAAAAEKALAAANDPELLRNAVHNKSASDRLLSLQDKATKLQREATDAADIAETRRMVAENAKQSLSEAELSHAGVQDKLGTAKTALSAQAQAARQAIREAPELLSDAKGVYNDAIKRAGAEAAASDLRALAPELVSDVAAPGFTDIGGGIYVKDVAAKALKEAVSVPPSELLKAIDVATNALKRYTTLGPLNAVPHVTRNIFSNHLFAAMYGGVKSPAIWNEAYKARKVLTKIIEEDGEVTLKSLAEHGLEGQAAKRALAMHERGLVGRGGTVFDEVGVLGREGEELGGKKAKGLLGTRTAEKVNTFHEEVSRGAVFLQGLDDGLSPAMAARKSAKAMLDYSQEGLTPFERDVLQRVIFFYKFPRRAVPAGVQFAFEHPGQAMAASRLGAGVDLGERNQYGEPLGLYMDTPLESAFSSINDLTSGSLDEGAGLLNPFLRAAVDPDQRALSDVLPPVAQFQRRAEGASTATGPADLLFRPGGGLLGPTPIPGGRIGVDYEARDTQEKDAEGLAKFKADTDGMLYYFWSPKQKLQEAAARAGIENPYSLTQDQLLRALAGAGVSEGALLQLMR